MGNGALKLGLFLNTQYPLDGDAVETVDRLLEQTQTAAELGFDCVMAGQHYLSHPYAMFAPVPLLARIASVAGSMRVATGVVLGAHAHPVAIAEEALTMDALTRGRFVLGMGLGYRDVEFDLFHLQRGSRAPTFERHLEAVVSLLEGRETDIDTPRAKATRARLSLRPVQRPRPPVWVAANAEKGLRRAAVMADAWLINPHARFDTLELQMTKYRSVRGAVGKDVVDVPVIREVCIADTDEEAFARARRYLAPKYEAYVSWGQDKALPSDDPLDLPFEDLARERFVIGSRDTCGDLLQQYRRELGATLVLARAQWPGMPHDHVMETLGYLGSVAADLEKAA